MHTPRHVRGVEPRDNRVHPLLMHGLDRRGTDVQFSALDGGFNQRTLRVHGANSCQARPPTTLAIAR